MFNLLSDIILSKVEGANGAGTSDVESDILDMQNADGVVFMGVPCTTANAANNIKVQMGDESDLSDAVDVDGSEITPAAANEIVAIDIRRPRKRYVRAVITRGVSTATQAIYGMLYNLRKPGVDNNETDVIQSVILNSPDEV